MITGECAAITEVILQKRTEYFLSVLELGAGHGVMSLLLKHYRPQWDILGIDLQANLVALANLNKRLLSASVCFEKKDLKTIEGTWTLIFGNPPFFENGKGRLSKSGERALSRHEILCTLDDVLACLKRCLAANGTAYLAYPDKRREELNKKAEKIGLAVKNNYPLQDNTKSQLVNLTELQHAAS